MIRLAASSFKFHADAIDSENAILVHLKKKQLNVRLVGRCVDHGRDISSVLFRGGATCQNQHRSNARTDGTADSSGDGNLHLEVVGQCADGALASVFQFDRGRKSLHSRNCISGGTGLGATQSPHVGATDLYHNRFTWHRIFRPCSTDTGGGTGL